MKIDINRLNLLEKDIEEWLFDNPGVLPAVYKKNPIVGWIGRQYQLPSGIADLIGVREDKTLVVVEVKNVAINKAAILQVCRYTHDLKHILSNRMDYPHVRDWNEPVIEMIVVGPSIESQTFTEAQAVNVRVFQFSPVLTLNIASLSWDDDYRDSIRAQHDRISARAEWSIYGITIDEDLENHRLERAARLLGDNANNQDADEASESDDTVTFEIALPAALTDNGYSDIILERFTPKHEDSDTDDVF